MFIEGIGEIEAVAFDIDGTLYPQWRLTVRAIFKYIYHCFFFLFYGIVRCKMHKLPPVENFRQLQAEKMAKWLCCTPEKAEKQLNKIVYDGLAPFFQKFSCYDNVPHFFAALKENGFKIGILSDFPPEQKGDIWGCKKYCDVVLGTEQLGALKPDAYSFLKLAESLNVECEKILYVGNSIKYDVKGAKNAKMKSAYLLSTWRKIFKKPLKQADFCFSNYRQFEKFMIK